MSRADALHAILHATYTDVVEGAERGQLRLFIGPRHAQALPDDELEILVNEFPDTGETAVIFHVMPLGPKFRTYREEHPNG